MNIILFKVVIFYYNHKKASQTWYYSLAYISELKIVHHQIYTLAVIDLLAPYNLNQSPENLRHRVLLQSPVRYNDFLNLHFSTYRYFYRFYLDFFFF